MHGVRLETEQCAASISAALLVRTAATAAGHLSLNAILFMASTPTPAVSASSAGSAFLDDGSLAALVAQAADLVDRLGLALGALEIGLVLVGM